jgi:LmbE family N-acetylglucosaminyl deacetylase
LAQKTSSELYSDLQKLASLKRILYVAAHPDDENTLALAWLSKGENAQTAYFSLTRGDGGQNLIGNELGAGLGILRSQELLAARNIDGSKQYFSRAVDFGYSKSATESLNKWGKEKILADAVKIIREFKPDVIITRFPADKRAGHGHHTASTMITLEAIDRAADKAYSPSHLKKLKTWQVTSVYWNTSIWWDKNLDSTATNNPNYLTFDIGTYNPIIGKSYNEIGTEARSQHKCQGFGAIIERGERKEYFQHLKGEKLKNSFFEKSTRTWRKLASKKTESDLNILLDNFDFKKPSNNVPSLLKIYKQLKSIKDDIIRKEKTQLCEELIKNCLGLHIDLLADDYAYGIGEKMNFTLTILNRSNKKIELKSGKINGENLKLIETNLVENKEIKNSFQLTSGKNYYNPYWLKKEYENLYQITDLYQIGKPQSNPSVTGTIELIIDSEVFKYDIKGKYKWREPSYGEKQREVLTTPAYAITIDKQSLISQSGETKKIKINVKGFKNKIQETIKIIVPKGWETSRKEFTLNIEKKYQEKFFELYLTPSKNAKSGELKLVNTKGEPIQIIHEISYNHIPTQVYFSNAKINLVKLNAKITKGKIGYIKGVEEKVPQAIEQLGFEVTVLDVADLASTDLNQFSTIVAGIRVYNIKPELINFKPKLMEFIKQGGNYIVQYNTASRNGDNTKEFGPYPFNLSTKRVTEENALPTFINKEHKLLNKPNKITEKDFGNWVQERGLYFAESWDDKYETIISWHDTNETPLAGGLIVTEYGKGNFMYTGISFFRELPAGVEGAYRLFANLLSYKRN